MKIINDIQPNSEPSAGGSSKPVVMRRTYFKCVVCGKLTAGRLSRDGSFVSDMSHRFPRRHKVGGQDCPGNIEESEWIDVPYGA